MRYRIFALAVLFALLFSHSVLAEQEADILSDSGILCLVNREKHLPKDYAPSDLVKPKVDTRKSSLQERIYMREEAAHALEDMFNAALTESALKLLAVSGYRSYGTQQVLFNQKAAAVSAATASLTVAKPGESEHQLGLAMDVQCPDTLTLSSNFAQTEEGRWVEENAHRFGFIIRYIGVAHATAVHMLNLPYETYYEQVIRLPEYVLTQGNPYLLAGAVQDLINGDESILALLPANAPDTDAALRRASQRYLPEDTSYQQAVWMGYPTPVPTPEPRVDTDTEEYSYSQMEGK